MIIDYKKAGVNRKLGDQASRIFFEKSKLTWENRRGMFGEIIECGHNFFSHRYSLLKGYNNLLFGINYDGIGTKTEIAERMKCHSTIAFDLFAMVCDDAAIRGYEPIHFGSILDFNKISIAIIEQLSDGMVQAAKNAKVAVINGEVAEIGDRVCGYGESSYNWGGSIFWAANENNIIFGDKVRPGQKIIGLREFGLRSNGISLIRKAFEKEYGKEWHNMHINNCILGEVVLKPSIIYSPFILEMSGGCSSNKITEIAGMAHITGGGIPEKLGRLLKVTGYGAAIVTPFPPCETGSSSR